MSLRVFCPHRYLEGRPRGGRGTRSCGLHCVLAVMTCVLVTTTLVLVQQAGPRPAGLPPPGAQGPDAGLRLLRAQRLLLRTQRRPPDDAYKLNVTISDATPLDRPILDTRPPGCRMPPSGGLPRASVVIPFYNEALSMLLRTVHSVLGRTPPDLLEEVLLVDDASTHDALLAPLAHYLKLLPSVTLLRNQQRQGLIRSRLRGADAARAPVLVFLDAHTEVNVGWLEPLLAELVVHPDSVVQPFIDGIDIQTLEYAKPSKLFKGSFSWDLRYVWVELAPHVARAAEEEGTPFWAVTLVGCALAVNRTFFYHLGGFDPGLAIWGGENLELAFRTWMCGGRVQTLPCSRVGHAFRPLPYSLEEDTTNPWQRNLMRVADTWMDGYSRYFYSSTRVYAHRRLDYTPAERASLKERQELRRRLGCRTFEWFLTHVAPDVPVPPRDALQHGEVTNYHTQACWEVLDDGHLAISYACYEHKLIPQNVFSLTRDGLLLYRNRCVRFLHPEPVLRAVQCPARPDPTFGTWHLVYKDQPRWAQVKVTLEVGGARRTWCVMQVTSAVKVHHGRQMPQTGPCDDTDTFQFWAFSYRFDYTD